MNKFEEYVTSWFNLYLEDHEDDETLLLTLFNTICPRKDGDFLSDWLGEDETVGDWLTACTPRQIYTALFVDGGHVSFDDMPDTEIFIRQMLDDAVQQLDLHEYSFTDQFIDDMTHRIVGYNSPIGFFDDLSHGGCSSGMVSILIYNDDCKKIYIDNIDDMEYFIEDEIDFPLVNTRKLPRYVFVCWICYEELAFRIAHFLFEDSF